MRKRWFSRQALSLHLAILIWFPGCLIAFWWQVNRAFGGNNLSYLYSVEWPAFAVVGVWGWWMLIHTDLDTVGRRAQERLQATQVDQAEQPAGQQAADEPRAPVAARRREEEDEALAAYNDRLANLAARGAPDLAQPMTTPRKVASRIVPGYVQDDEADPTKGLAGAVLRYRVMAYIVGTGLLILVFIGVPLQYGANIPQVDAIVGPIHGFLYIVYLLAAVDLARRARFTLLQMAAMIGAGFLPFLAFIIEHRVMKRLGLLPPKEAGGSGAAPVVRSDAADTGP